MLDYDDRTVGEAAEDERRDKELTHHVPASACQHCTNPWPKFINDDGTCDECMFK